jgi:hypothetical protein
VASDEILDGSVTSADLGFSSVGSDQIATDAVNATEIADNSIDGGEIVDNSLTANDLASSSVGNSEIASGAVTSSKLGSNSVDSSKIVANSVTTSDLKGADVNGSFISLGSGAVANGRCKNFDVTIGGATTGEAVVFSLKATPPEGMIFYGVRVRATNIVVVAACNFTGGTSPTITDLPVRVITFG